MHRLKEELPAFIGDIKSFAHTYLIAIPRSAAFLGATILVVLLALWAYAQAAGPAVYRLVEPLSAGVASDAAITVITMLPLLLIAAALSLVWAGVVSLLAAGALAAEDVSSSPGLQQ